MLRKTLVSVIIQLAFFGGLPFAVAGTLDWWREWVFVGVVCVATAATMLAVFPGREDLLRERFKPPVQKGQPVADRVVLLGLLVSFVGEIVLIPLDVFRLHLLSAPGRVAAALGLVLFAEGWWITALALRENTFAAPVVRLQRERGHALVDTGVYSVVRHPMYAGGILLFVGMPLWLESYAATLAAAVPIAFIAARVHFEERFLRRELSGYEEYTQRVRSRLIPGVW